jgi:hypothetical protein
MIRFHTPGPKLHSMICALLGTVVLAGCGSLMNRATDGMTENLGRAILNQDDPELVRDGAPAYLLLLDSFVEGAPDNPSVLSSAARLYAAYGVLFVTDRERAGRLTTRALNYGQRALCASNEAACAIRDLPYSDFTAALEDLEKDDVDALYTFSLSWFGYIRVHSADMAALSKLPHAEAALRRVQELDPQHEAAELEHYLGVLGTIRPPALGGDFPAGEAHFLRAIELTGGNNLAIKVDYARYYARTLYERELHDALLQEVLTADPTYDGYTLFNVIAQRQAADLLASANDYF